MSRARLFLAVVPPPDVADVLEALPRPDLPGVRWTGREQWHVTLRFLGVASVPAAAAALAGVHAPACRAELGPATTLLGRRVLVVPVSGLDALAAEVRAATAGVGEPPDHPFAGHVTIARLRRGAPGRLGGCAVQAGFVVDEVLLVASELRPEGARHAVVERRRLEEP